MANPIKASDLYQDDGAIDKAIQNLEALAKAHEATLKKIQAQAKDLESQVNGLSSATSAHRDQIKKSAQATDQLEKEQKKLQDTYTDTARQIATLRELKKEQNRILQLEAKLAKATEGSYEALSAQYSLNRIQINKLSKEYLENTKEGRKLVKETKALRDAMKESQAATGNMSLNVGNYTESIREALPITGKLADGLRVLAKTPLLAVLTLIVGAVTAVVEAFKRTERGAELLAKVSGILSGLFSAFVGIVDRLATRLIKVFEDPQQALKDFGDLIKSQIVNRFEGLLGTLGALGRAIGRLLTADLKGAKEAFLEAGDAGIKFLTGLDENQQKEFTDALKETTDAIKDQTNAFAALASAQRAVRKENRVLARQLEEITTKAELYSRIAGDTTVGFQEQAKAVEEAQKAIEEKARLELRIAQNNLSLINQELKLRRSQGEEVEDLADQQLQAFQALKQAERDLTLAIRDNAQQRREIARDEFERELDFAIDAFDTIKAVNERRIKDDQVSFEERIRILKETRRLTEESFQDQIKLTEDFVGQKLDLDQLALESDQRVIRERLRAADIDDVTLGRILEIIRERKLALQDLTEVEQDLYKAQGKAARDASLTTLQALESTSKGFQERAREALSQARVITERASQPGTLDLFEASLGVTQENRQAFEDTYKSAFASAKQALSDFLSERVRLADVAVQSAERETQAAQSALDAELQLQRDGLANRVDTAKEELRQAEANQRIAIRNRERAARAQRQIQAVEQASNLVAASAKIWAQLGFPLALPAIAVMWGSFVAAKVRAASLARDNFREGGFEILQGGSHQSGRDIPLGVRNGRERRAEGGEGLAIFSKASMSRYGGQIPEIVTAINTGSFEALYSRITQAGRPNVVVAAPSVNTRGMEGELARIRQQGERRMFTDGRGRRVEIYRNLKRTYRNG